MFQCVESETVEEIIENNYQRSSCGDPLIATIFFTLYQLIVTQVFLNLFIAIIIDAFLG